MKNLKFILLIFLLTFILFCTRPPRGPVTGTYDPKTLFWLPKTYNFEKVRTFNFTFGEVWLELLNLLNSSKMLGSIKTIDKGSGVIILEELQTPDTTISDCGQYTHKIKTYRGWRRFPTGQIMKPRIVNTVFYVKSLDLLRTQIEMTNDFHISWEHLSGILTLVYPRTWKCVSTGRLEPQFFQMIETRLSSPKGSSGAK